MAEGNSIAITITKRILSGSTHGQAVGISASRGATPITIHQLSTSATTTVDELYLYANNAGTANAQLILEIGGSNTANQIWVPVYAQAGPTLVVPGLILTGSACGIYGLMTGAAGTASDAGLVSNALVTVYGFVNRMVQT